MELAGRGNDAPGGLQLVVDASWLVFYWSISPEQPLLFAVLLCNPGSQEGFKALLCSADMAPQGCCGSLCILNPAVLHPQCLLAGRAFSSSPLPLA